MGYDLTRFIQVQQQDYPFALDEIKKGRKKATGSGTSFHN